MNQVLVTNVTCKYQGGLEGLWFEVLFLLRLLAHCLSGIYPSTLAFSSGLSGLYESPTFLVNAALACHVVVSWCISAFPISLLDSNTLRVNW